MCHTPLSPYAVNAFYQHHIHLTSEDGLCYLLQSWTIQRQTAAVFVSSADNRISSLFRIAAKFRALRLKTKPVIVGHTTIKENSHTHTTLYRDLCGGVA